MNGDAPERGIVQGFEPFLTFPQSLFHLFAIRDIVNNGKQQFFAFERNQGGMHFHIPDFPVCQSVGKMEKIAFFRTRICHFPKDFLFWQLVDPGNVHLCKFCC